MRLVLNIAMVLAPMIPMLWGCVAPSVTVQGSNKGLILPVVSAGVKAGDNLDLKILWI